MTRVLIVILLLIAISRSAPVQAQSLGGGERWRYELLEGSAVMDDCPICDRVSFWIPIHGSFDLVSATNTQLSRVENIDFVSDYSDKPEWKITGWGTVESSNGDRELTVDISIQRAEIMDNVHLTNEAPENPRIYPMLSLLANESPGSLSRVYRLRIYAAPIREVWFSTTEPLGDLGPGDLLSTMGRTVKKNSELTDRLELIEPTDISLDALDVGPRGEIFFSSVTNAESFVNGTVGNGDIITSGGRVYLENAQLLTAFGVDDPEAGLDALHIKSEDEIYFSISKEATRSNGPNLRRGDILSSKGLLLRSEPNLLLRYQNPFTNSVGVDALYIWPNGEIWFSTETNFDSAIGPIDAGDLLSDQGYIAIRNADLVARFKPALTTSHGLDAVTVISDASASAALNQILEITYTTEGAGLRWESAARVFQLEKAENILGPWQAVSEIITERSSHDFSLAPAAFYRVRQW